jgi:hypothetical protein
MGVRASLLSPSDLSVAGWLYPPGRAASRAVTGGRQIKSSDIEGVVTRIPWIYEHDLQRLAPEDRAYAAAEMSAFLLAWLSQLRCPVLNQPTPTCLAGPFWRHEKWVHTAAQLGIPVFNAHRDTRGHGLVDAGPLRGDVTVDIVGRNCYGEVSATASGFATQLAGAAGVDLLTVRFDCAGPQPRFCAASIWPDITVPQIADALLQRMSLR